MRIIRKFDLVKGGGEMQGFKRMTVLLLAILLCLLTLVSAGLLVHGSLHENCDDHCLVCAGIARCDELSNTRIMAFLAMILVAIFFATALKVIRENMLLQKNYTLLTLGVALLN